MSFKTGILKILVIRLSSIGDVVLTLPVVGWLKSHADVEVHLLTKRITADLLSDVREIDAFHVFDNSVATAVEELKKENFDAVLDLHNNRRSRRVRMALGVRSFVYRKENLHKMLYVLTKHDFMSGRHVVDRYMVPAQRLMQSEDCNPAAAVEWCVPETDFCPKERYAVIACGAQHATKRIPPAKIAELAAGIHGYVVLVGDAADAERIGESVAGLGSRVINLCGKTTLKQSASVVKDAKVVVSSDSAIMHIAAAMHRPVVAVWGSTTPRFGFYAYGTEHFDFEVQNVRCRPCGRMGSEHCRKGHFDCMMRQNWDAITQKVNELMDR